MPSQVLFKSPSRYPLPRADLLGGPGAVDAAFNPPPGGSTLHLASDWSHATGVSLAAFTDGGVWDTAQGWDSGNAQLTLNVIPSSEAPAPFRSTNVLRITQRGSLYNGNLIKANALPLGESTFGELFVLNGGDTQTHNHPLAYTPTFGFQAIPYGMSGNSANWAPFVRFDPAIDPTVTYPRVSYLPGVQGVAGQSRLANNTWYRYRYHLHHYDPANPLRYRLYPYIYSYDHANPNSLGTLLFDASTFFEQDYGGQAGRNLQARYNEGGYHLMNSLENARTVTWGQEGSGGAADTGQHWYTSDFSIRTGGWGPP
jgi:hypothetical protein